MIGYLTALVTVEAKCQNCEVKGLVIVRHDIQGDPYERDTHKTAYDLENEIANEAQKALENLGWGYGECPKCTTQREENRIIQELKKCAQ